MSDKTQAALEAAATTDTAKREMTLTLAKDKLLTHEQTQAVQLIQELSIRAGRVQAAKLMSNFSDAVLVSQLREAKAKAKAAKIPWGQVCDTIGISIRTADQYLKLAADLGDDFYSACRQLGLSVRTLEAARRLPEDIRQKLIAGEIVDPESATAEQLTGVIRDLAKEHAQEKEVSAAELKKEQKAKAKAEKQAEDWEFAADDLGRQLDAIKLGLSINDNKALLQLKEAETNIIMRLTTIRNTTAVSDRDDALVLRILNSLALIQEYAEATLHTIAAKAEGQIPDEEALLGQAQQYNQQAAAADGREPYVL